MGWKDYNGLVIGMVRTGILGYGGGPSVIPLIRYEAVTRYKWVSDEEFGEILAIANALPVRHRDQNGRIPPVIKPKVCWARRVCTRSYFADEHRHYCSARFHVRATRVESGSRHGSRRKASHFCHAGHDGL